MTGFTGEIHPVADLFPMMTEDELNDLAEDIKANGLIHPIVVDEEGRLIDGRNRFEACRRAGVVPQYVALNGHEPVAYILGSNVARRHLSKGQQAMAVAMAQRLLNSQSNRQAARSARLSRQYVDFAAVVLEYAPDLAPIVLSGAMPLNDAYQQGRERKSALESDEAKFARLQSEHADLAVMVQEGQLTLVGALAEAEERRKAREEEERKAREYLQMVSKQLATVLLYLDPENIPAEEVARDLLKADPDFLGEPEDFSAARARRAAEVLMEYARLKGEKE